MYKQFAKSFNIPVSTFGNYTDYKEYFRDAPTSGMVILCKMQEIAQHVGEVVFLGGHTAREFLLGSRVMRKPSFDIDMYIPQTSLQELSNFAHQKKYPFFLHTTGDCFFLEMDNTPVSISVDSLYGEEIGKQHTLNTKLITILTKDKLAKCKILRGQQKGDLRGKDQVDIANMMLDDKYPPLDFLKIKPDVLKKITSVQALKPVERTRIIQVCRNNGILI